MISFWIQDANECWTQMIRMLQQKLPAVKKATTEETPAATSTPASLIDQYFGENAATLFYPKTLIKAN